MAKRALTVYYDEEGGTLARLEWAPGFEAESALMRADVLKDLLHDLGHAYSEAVDDILPEARESATPTV